MPIHNQDIAAIFEKVADLLEIEGANPFRVRAYRNAARVVSGTSQSLADLLARGDDLTGLPGVGQDLAGKIREIITSGDLGLRRELEARTPPALALLLNLGGLGPKRVQLLHQKLGITSTADLKEAAQSGKIKEIKGFGPKIEQHDPGGPGSPQRRREALQAGVGGARGRVAGGTPPGGAGGGGGHSCRQLPAAPGDRGRPGPVGHLPGGGTG